ncbi:ThiF family adenylyltransferase [Deinococcus misasensis]|uniref:ThiF family adenylyltransferase n=1 Tax=Deinococcus misasensis TaxID=392413 RepID=UPI0012FBB3E7|nr:ThiF family adenylyltransferase [Deinococcus misasensis]
MESQDIRVFSPTLTIRELGLQLDWLFQEGEMVGPNLFPSLDVLEQSKQVPIEAMNVSFFLSSEAAARFNGDDPEDSNMLAVGVGALGSQVLANLTRAGFGRWGAVDDDVFMPHNAARHLLTAIHTGQSKAAEVAGVLNRNFDDQDLVRPFHENIFATPTPELQQALQEARVIVDFSASVAAARHLALNVQSPARRVSVFLSPSGRDLVVLAEDEGRTFTLDQLEVQYYQWLWDNEDLHDHLQRPDDLLWYGTGCRDVSSRLPQDLVALHSATASRVLKGILKGKEAGIFLWRASPETGEVTRLTLTPEVPLKYRTGGWTLQVSPTALQKMQALRSADLPGETGGTLIGTRDLPRKTLYVTGVLGAPEDSQKALKTFIRGSRKLLFTYERIRQVTLRNLTYLGEWHSHPDGVPARPSLDDIMMFTWLQEQLGVEGFPALMGIVGQKDHHFFLDDLKPAVPMEEVQDA